MHKRAALRTSISYIIISNARNQLYYLLIYINKEGEIMPSYKDDTTGKWYVSFYYTDARGKRVRKMKRGFNLKRDADKWEREFLTQDHPEEITIGTLIKAYLKDAESQCAIGNIKKTTLYSKKLYIKLYIEPYWGELLANRVKVKDVNNWLKNITNQKVGKTKERRASSTINNARLYLKQIFDFGKSNYGIKNNPVMETKPLKPYSNDKRASFWTLEQYKAFRETVNNKAMVVLFDLIFYAGLRIGEAFALTPKDISEYKIKIERRFYQLPDDDTPYDKPKTERSRRDIAIPKFLYEELQDYIKHNDAITENSILFPFTEMAARLILDSRAKRLGFPKISPHILRHSYASILLNISKDATVVASQLGHADPGMTLKIYTHMLPDEDREAVDQLEQLAKGKKK